ncbi:MAG: class I SAM-dependent methyltransferase [Bacteroidota bacterium]
MGKNESGSSGGYTDYYSQCNTTLVKEYFNLLQQFSPHGNGTTLLDIGCGPGSLLRIGDEHGWQCTGLEISKWAVETGKNNGLDIIEGTLQDAQFQDNQFDIVSMFDVLEHLPIPHDYIREIWRILKPGGKLIAETPNIDGFFVRNLYRENADLVKPRDHLCIYSPSTARRLLESYHFSSVIIKTFPYCRKFTPGYFKSLLMTRLKPNAIHRQFTFNESLRIIATK